jgi:hypothetical protein
MVSHTVAEVMSNSSAQSTVTVSHVEATSRSVHSATSTQEMMFIERLEPTLALGALQIL